MPCTQSMLINTCGCEFFTVSFFPLGKAPMEAVVLKDYTPISNGNVLRLEVGQVLKNVRKVDEDWAEGELLGKVGFFPSNFVQMPEEHPPPPLPPGEECCER